MSLSPGQTFNHVRLLAHRRQNLPCALHLINDGVYGCHALGSYFRKVFFPFVCDIPPGHSRGVCRRGKGERQDSILLLLSLLRHNLRLTTRLFVEPFFPSKCGLLRVTYKESIEVYVHVKEACAAPEGSAKKQDTAISRTKDALARDLNDRARASTAQLPLCKEMFLSRRQRDEFHFLQPSDETEMMRIYHCIYLSYR